MTVGENKKRKQSTRTMHLGDKRGERLGRESEKSTLMKCELTGGVLP